jgi:pimeloyl-ACP methyl ester carboxylesterase
MTPFQTSQEMTPVQSADAHSADILRFPPRQEGFLFVTDDHVTSELPAGTEAMPVRRPVRGLGQVAYKAVRETGLHRPEQAVRHHRLYGVTIDDYQHAVEITDPEHGEPQYAIMSLPGFTEHIECGIRQSFHSSLAELFPQARIISVGSDGIGPNSSTYDWQDRKGYNIDGMARHRVELALALTARLPLFVQATSMGSVISQRMNETVLADPSVREMLDLRGQFYTSPALVDPSNIVRDMGIRFLPGLGWDFAKELLLKSTRDEAKEVFRQGKNYGISGADKTALVNQLWSLLHGTPESAVHASVSEVPTVVVAGEKDSLAQWKMWRRIAADQPDNLELHPIRGRGHVMAMKPGRTCDKLARTAQAAVCQSLGTAEI